MPHESRGRGGFVGFSLHWFEWHIFNRNVLDSCVKGWQYFSTDNLLLESVHWPSKNTVKFKIEACVYQKFAKMKQWFCTCYLHKQKYYAYQQQSMELQFLDRSHDIILSLLAWNQWKRENPYGQNACLFSLQLNMSIQDQKESESIHW